MNRINFPPLLSVIIFSTILITGGCSQHAEVVDYLTIEQAMDALPLPQASLPVVTDPQTEIANRPAREYVALEPVKLFDNMYWAGTRAVGMFLFETGDGLIMLDTGYGPQDCSVIVPTIKDLGLYPSEIKLIIISHEHIDHYGGTNYFLENVCPDAKVAMSLIGWNMLQTVPAEWAYGMPRPKKCDIFLTDGMKLKLGDFTIQCVLTPGHSPGCMSFIFPVTDNGEPHMAGVLGGSAVWPTQVETRLYQSSVEYFKAFTDAAKCDVGVGVHFRDPEYSAALNRKASEPHPLLYPGEKYNTVYLGKFRASVKRTLESGRMTPYSFPMMRMPASGSGMQRPSTTTGPGMQQPSADNSSSNPTE